MKKNKIEMRIEMKYSYRTRTFILSMVIIAVLVSIAVAGLVMNPQAYEPNYEAKKLAPCLSHLFGTDYLGRDMFCRTIKGLSNSILIGVLAAGVSAFIALIFGVLSAMAGGIVDKVIAYLVDMFMAIPHIVLLMLISFMLGGGLKGVVVGIAVTHWPNLTRVIRAEVLEIKNAEYVLTAKKLGRTWQQIAFEHILPHIFPQFIVGVILLFPHAILHEAGITFLGFGLSLDMPAIGVILSEALKHISTGMWWLVFFPGIMLVLIVMMFDKLGDYIKKLLNPGSSQE